MDNSKPNPAIDAARSDGAAFGVSCPRGVLDCQIHRYWADRCELEAIAAALLIPLDSVIDHLADEIAHDAARRAPPIHERRSRQRPGTRKLLSLLAALAFGLVCSADAKPRAFFKRPGMHVLRPRLPRELVGSRIPLAHVPAEAIPADGLPLAWIRDEYSGAFVRVVLYRDSAGRASVAAFEPFQAPSGKRGRKLP